MGIIKRLFGRSNRNESKDVALRISSADDNVRPGRFVAIDFETANYSRSSACAIGYAVVENGRIVESGSRFIKPYPFEFDPYLMAINNISPDMVRKSPPFLEVWQKEIERLIVGKSIVAHNATFDISVLRHALDITETPYPETNYYCTRTFAKSVWPSWENHHLETATDQLKIKFQHHDPEQDAIACAMIAIRACQLKKVSSPDDLCAILQHRPGKLFANGYNPHSTRSSRWSRLKVSGIVPETDDFDSSHPLYAQHVVFTGPLESMSRREAAQAVVNAGGICPSSVSAKVNYLVVGEQDYKLLADGKKSKKLKRAEELIAQGKNLEIIYEQEFLEMIE